MVADVQPDLLELAPSRPREAMESPSASPSAMVTFLTAWSAAMAPLPEWQEQRGGPAQSRGYGR